MYKHRRRKLWPNSHIGQYSKVGHTLIIGYLCNDLILEVGSGRGHGEGAGEETGGRGHCV